MAKTNLPKIPAVKYNTVDEDEDKQEQKQEQKQTQTPYYTKPELYTDRNKLGIAATKAQGRAKQAKDAVSTAQTKLQEAQEFANFLQQRMAAQEALFKADESNPTNRSNYLSTRNDWFAAADAAEAARAEYDTAYGLYENNYREYTAAADTYNRYIKDQQAKYDAWRSTIRDSR